MAKWKWCLVDDNSTLLTGWQQVDEAWYYLYNNGVMATGWTKIEDKWYYLDEDGAMQTGWLQDKDKWYYLNTVSDGNKGVMYANCTITIDNKEYAFNADGSMVEDKITSSNSLVSDNCINFVKSYEGFSATKYDDGTGVITQGYGCIGDEIADWEDTITEEVASAKLKDLINNKYATVIKASLDNNSVILTQYQFDALVSMSYNIGTSALLGSTLYKRILSGVRDETLKDNFTVWCKAGGKTMQGLLNRRIEEYEMFANADYVRSL